MTINERVSDATIDGILSGVIEGVEPTSQEIAMAAEIKQYRAAAEKPVAFTEAHEISNMHATGLYLRAWPADRERNEAEGYTIPLYAVPQVTSVHPAKNLELAGWQFKSVNGDWLGLIGEHGKNQAVREGCVVREVFAMADGINDREQVRREHAAWSESTFGNVGPIGPLKHLSKEALEAAAEPDDLSEWADMQFLLWDAQRRAGITDEQITQAMVEKLAVNKQREWPEPKDGEPRLHIAAPALQAEQLSGNTEQVEPVSATNKLGGWIPVSERMPDTMISVLVTGDWFHHGVSFWDGASWCDLDFEPPVTHWMPLPAAPKQEAE